MSDVFLSYASEDRARAESIARALQAEGWSVWWDRNIPAGKRFREVIHEEIGRARSVVVLWSAASIKKDWVIDEAEDAKKRDALIPVLIEQVQQPRGFQQIQAASLSGWSGDPDDAAFRALCKDLASMLRLPEDVTGYLTALWNLTRQIDIKNLRTSDGSANAFDIDELYTPLTTVLPHEQRGKPGEAESAAANLEKALKEPRLVLVGDPGAGKTTFLRRIAFEACHRLLAKERPIERMLSDPAPFPILISAGNFATHIQNSKDKTGARADPKSPEWLLHYLDAAYPKLGAACLSKHFEKKCLLLLDGLDEIPGERAREEMTELLKRTADGWPDLQIVATSRPGVYGGVTSVPGFTAHKIASLDKKALETFAIKWGHAVYPQDEPRAAELTRVLLNEINAKPEIRLMAGNPVMLTALACLHFSKTTLPEQRSELYDSVLEWLSKARQSKTGVDHNVLLGRLRKLAYAMHAGKENKRTEIDRYEAVGLLKNDFRIEQDEDSKRLAAEGFLKEEEVNSGIIVNRGDKLRFWHPTFQEYLAAVRLAYDPMEREKRLFDARLGVHHPDWREKVLLLAGCLKKQGDEPVDELLGKSSPASPRSLCSTAPAVPGL